MNFFLFFSVILLIDIILNFLISKTTRMPGVDLIFFAAWIGGIKYGVLLGFLASVIIIAERSILSPQQAMLKFLSIPVQFAAALLGSLMGESGFFVTLIAYQIANTVLVALVQALGGRFVIFLLINSAFNYLIYKIYI